MANRTTPKRTWSDLLRWARRWTQPDTLRSTTRQRAEAAASISQHPSRDPVGYLINRADGLTGTQGTGYDYVWASNGLFIQSQSDLIVARIRLTNQPTKGLLPTEEKIDLIHGRIPTELLTEGLNWTGEEPETERYFAIVWAGDRYQLRYTDQQGTTGSVTYHTPQLPTIAEFHSHGPHAPFFSSTDDSDEQGFRVYGVTSHNPGKEPKTLLRLGIYGHYREMTHTEILTQQQEPPP